MSYWLGISNTVIYLLIYSIFLLQVTCWGILVSSALLEIVAQIYTFSMNLHEHVFPYFGIMLPTYTFWPSPCCTQRHGLVKDKGFSFFSILVPLLHLSPGKVHVWVPFHLFAFMLFLVSLFSFFLLGSILLPLLCYCF